MIITASPHAHDILIALCAILALAGLAASAIMQAACVIRRHRYQRARHRACPGQRTRAQAAQQLATRRAVIGRAACGCEWRGPYRCVRTRPCDTHGSAQAASAHLQKAGSR